MPKGTEVYNDSTGRRQSRTTGTDESAVGAAAKQDKDRQSLAGLAAKTKGGATSGKMLPGETLQEFATRQRKEREGVGRSTALKGMLAEKQ